MEFSFENVSSFFCLITKFQNIVDISFQVLRSLQTGLLYYFLLEWMRWENFLIQVLFYSFLQFRKSCSLFNMLIFIYYIYISMFLQLCFKSNFEIIQMADIQKIKPKKNFEWEQDNKSVRITVNMPDHKSMKNVEIFLSDLVLRITSKQKKTAHVIDFDKEINYLSAQNKFTLIDGKVIATLKKKTAENWQKLIVQDLNHQQIQQRRKSSMVRYEDNIKEVEQLKEKLKNEHQRLATKQIMRFEEEEHKKLQGKKQREKEEALNEVFRNVDEKTGKIEYEQKKWVNKGLKALQNIEEEEQKQRKRREEERKREKEAKILGNIEIKKQKKQKQPSKSMFTEDDVQKFDQMRNQIQQQLQQIPIRQGGKVNIKFSQKMYPGVAARDFHYTEPPLPKGSLPLPPTKGDLQNNNPLWLKDKGDRFMKDKNYVSAIQAYNESLKIDGKHTKSLMNRSLAHMKRFNFQACILDCDAVLLQMQNQIVGSEQGNDEALLDIIKVKTRKALCLSWKGKFKQGRQILQQQLTVRTLDEKIKQQIKGCIENISKRQQSLKIKLKGDELVKRNNYKDAMKYYNQSIQIDNNEYAISNKCLCLNKNNQFKESIQIADIGIKKLNQFGIGNHNSTNKEQSTILLKLLYRKAKSQSQSGFMKEAEETLKSGLSISPEDKDFKNQLKIVKSREIAQQLKKQKAQASQLLKKDNAEGALNIYVRCLKMLQNLDNTSEYLSILQNQCVCYLKLKQYDSIISASIRILKIVNNLKSKFVEFGEKKNTIDKGQLDKISIRTLMRRANAYVKTGQLYNAKSDLQKAKQIDPNDATIHKELEKLKNSL